MEDMNLIQAAGEVRKLLRGIRAVELISDAMDSIGSIQNAGKEATKELEATRALVATAKADLAAAQGEVAAAKEEARKIASEAKRKAEDRILKADVEIAVKVSDMDARVAAATVQVSALEDVAKVAKAEVIAATQELEEINGKIAKAKAGIAKILGT